MWAGDMQHALPSGMYQTTESPKEHKMDQKNTAVLQIADTMKLLCKFKADVNVPNDAGVTPLKSAVDNGDFEFVDLLVQNRAEVDGPMIDGLLPIHVAAMRGFLCVFSNSELERLFLISILSTFF